MTMKAELSNAIKYELENLINYGGLVSHHELGGYDKVIQYLDNDILSDDWKEYPLLEEIVEDFEYIYKLYF